MQHFQDAIIYNIKQFRYPPSFYINVSRLTQEFQKVSPSNRNTYTHIFISIRTYKKKVYYPQHEQRFVTTLYNLLLLNDDKLLVKFQLLSLTTYYNYHVSYSLFYVKYKQNQKRCKNSYFLIENKLQYLSILMLQNKLEQIKRF